MPPRRQSRRTFKRINPWGQVPTLVLPDGSLLTETAAILIYLAAIHSDKALGPSPGSSNYPAFLRWIVFANVNVYESVLRAVYPSRFTTDTAMHDATRVAGLKRMHDSLVVLDSAVDEGPFLLGDTMSVADIYIAMLFIWYRDEIDAPRLTRLTEIVRQHPQIASLWQRHFGHR